MTASKFIAAAILFGWGMLSCGLIDAARGVPVEWVVNSACSMLGVACFIAFYKYQ